MNLESLKAHQETLINLAVAYVPQVLLALLTLVVGLWLIGVFTRLLRKTLDKRG